MVIHRRAGDRCCGRARGAGDGRSQAPVPRRDRGARAGSYLSPQSCWRCGGRGRAVAGLRGRVGRPRPVRRPAASNAHAPSPAGHPGPSLSSPPVGGPARLTAGPHRSHVSFISAPVSGLTHGLTGGELWRVGRATASAASWRTSASARRPPGRWSPNSCAIRLAQPRVPNWRTVRLIASATLSVAGASDRCSPEANSAAHRGSSRSAGPSQYSSPLMCLLRRGLPRRERGRRGGRSGRATRR